MWVADVSPGTQISLATSCGHGLRDADVFAQKDKCYVHVGVRATVYRHTLIATGRHVMSMSDFESVERQFEECVDELDGAIAALEKFSDIVIAYALRAHLGALLSALLECGLCTQEAAREFLSALEQGVLEAGTQE